MGQPTPEQHQELWRQIVAGKITSCHMKALLDGITLTSFTHRVNYDDPRWQTIDFKRYPVCFNPWAVVEDNFPNKRTGQYDVEYEYVDFNLCPSTKKVMRALKEAGLDRPDRAETDTFLDENPGEIKKYTVVGICGTESGGGVGCVSEDANGRGLQLRGLLYGWDELWDLPCRFLGVRRRTPVSP